MQQKQRLRLRRRHKHSSTNRTKTKTPATPMLHTFNDAGQIKQLDAGALVEHVARDAGQGGELVRGHLGLGFCAPVTQGQAGESEAPTRGR
jgi:hypothetical protein